MGETAAVPVLRLTVASEVLDELTSISAILPDGDRKPERPASGHPASGHPASGRPASGHPGEPTPARPTPSPAPTPTLYLLHGLGDDDGAWLRRSAIAEHVAGSGLAVVMPSLGSSFGVDEAEGRPYGTFLAQELPALVERHLGLAPPRAATFVAGLSMGGYAALRWALHHPERFAAAAALSGSLDIADPDRYRRRPALMQRLFAGRTVTGGPDDLLWLLGHPGAAGAPPPALYVACGTEDTHLAENRRFVDAARAAGVPPTTDFGPGAHDWPYWDRAIRTVLNWLPLRSPNRG